MLYTLADSGGLPIGLANMMNNDQAFINSHSSPTTTSNIQNINKALLDSNESQGLDDELVAHIREALAPYNSHPSCSIARRSLLKLIGEYLREEMTLKRFFRELRELPTPMSAVPGDIYRWLVQLFINSDKDSNSTCKLVGFLMENGVDENDIEYGSVKRLLNMYHPDDNSDKKARERGRIRKSVSKGLRNPPNKWTKEESQRLIQLVHDYGDKSWKKIAEHVGGGKTGAQCAQHWKRVLCPIIRKGSWDDLEEMKLFQLVEKYGQSWKNIASEIGTRTDIQCRYQYFKSCMSREVPWSPQEDDLLLKKMNDIKEENREIHWVEVARYMARGRLTKIPRTALECRIRWDTISAPSQGSASGVNLGTNDSGTRIPASLPPLTASTSPSLSPFMLSIHADLPDLHIDLRSPSETVTDTDDTDTDSTMEDTLSLSH